MNPTYTQLETVTKEHRNLALVSYTVALHTATKHGHEIDNVATPRQNKKELHYTLQCTR